MIFPPRAFLVVFSSVIIFCPVLSNPLNSCSVSCDSSSFCDSYENQCQPCSQLCEVTGDLGECGAKCPLYLHTVIHASRMERSSLHHLTIMVAVIAVMTFLVLTILSLMIVMKLRKRRRLAKKILPSTLYSLDKDKVKILDTRMETISARGLETGSRANEGFVRSPSTVVTQLSREDSVPSDGPITRPPGPPEPASGSRRSLTMSDQSRPRRLASEDRVQCSISQAPGGDPRLLTPRQYSEVV